jgi:hypothetical protein
MDKKYAAKLNNVTFLNQIGTTLRLATADIAREDLPTDVHLLLRRLDRLDARDRAREQRTKSD